MDVAIYQEDGVESGETAELETTLSELAPVDELEREVSTAEELYAEIVERETRVEAGERIREELEKTARLADSTDAEVRSLAGLPAPPPMHDIAALEALIGNLRAADLRYAKANQESSALSRLSEAPELSDTTDLERLIGELELDKAILKEALEGKG